MKNNGITVAIALASALMAGQSFAADGTVHFRGEVIDSTCEVTPDTADQTVNIGRVAKTTFSGIDSTASVKDFHIINWINALQPILRRRFVLTEQKIKTRSAKGICLLARLLTVKRVLTVFTPAKVKPLPLPALQSSSST